MVIYEPNTDFFIFHTICLLCILKSRLWDSSGSWRVSMLCDCALQWYSGRDRSVASLYTTRTALHCWTCLTAVKCLTQTFTGIIRSRNCECLQMTAVDLSGLTSVKMGNRQVKFADWYLILVVNFSRIWLVVGWYLPSQRRWCWMLVCVCVPVLLA